MPTYHEVLGHSVPAKILNYLGFSSVSSLSFSVCYVFKSRICNVHLVSIFILLLLFVLQTEISDKYYSPFIVVFFIYFSYHSFYDKDQFTVLILKFDIEDFTDPGLLKSRLTLTGLSLWFCLHKCFLYN